MVYDPKANTWSWIRPMKHMDCLQRVVGFGKALFALGGWQAMDVYNADRDRDEWRPLKLWGESKPLVIRTEAWFTAKGNLYMANPFGIYGCDIDAVGNVSWAFVFGFRSLLLSSGGALTVRLEWFLQEIRSFWH
ncbi:unnamed protein product [Calypogeia fissa]